MYPPVDVIADDITVVRQHPAPSQPRKHEQATTAEEREIALLAESVAAVSSNIRRVEHALKTGVPYMGTKVSSTVLFGELSSLRREKSLLLEKDLRLQQRVNLLLTRHKNNYGGGSVPDNKGDLAGGKAGRNNSSSEPENEDERILQRVDSFSILIVVSTLVTGFSIPAIEQAQLHSTRVLMTLVFALEMFATIFFSIISFYAKQAFNYGSTNNQRTARFLYHVRWITFSSQACYTIGIILFVAAILSEVTYSYETYWALAGVVPIFLLSVVCWVLSAYALISLRMGLWTHNLLLFDADTKLIDAKRCTFIPAATSFRDWLGQEDNSHGTNPC